MKLAVLVATLALPVAAETLEYRAEWRFFDAGRAVISAERDAKTLDLKTHGVVGKMHFVDDRYSALYRDGHCVASSRLEAKEGDSRSLTAATFEAPMARWVETDLATQRQEKAEAPVPACVHDVIGALWKLRELRMAPGTETRLPLSDGRKSISARVAALRVETVKVGETSYRAVKHEAFLYNGVFYRRKGRLFFWLTDDERRLPVQIKVELPFYIGDVTLKLDTAKLDTAKPDTPKLESAAGDGPVARDASLRR